MCCSVNGSVCLVCCVFDSVCELFGETIRNVFGCSCYFVMEVFSVCGGAMLDRPYMVFQGICVLCLYPNMHLSVPAIGFVYFFVCRKLSPHLRI